MPAIPKKDKNKKKIKNIKNKKGKAGKKKSKAKFLIPVILLLLLGVIGFLIFGGDLVPEKIRDVKGYSNVTVMVKEKLPHQIQLPFEFPNPSNLLGKIEIPNKDEIINKMKAALPGDKSDDEESKDETSKESKEVVSKENKNETSNESKAETSEESKNEISKESKVVSYDEVEESTSDYGVDNKRVTSDQSLFSDIPEEWKRSKVKVIEHRTDRKAGTDTVVVYMELVNEYVNMTGTKELTYLYNEKTKDWESTGSATKLNCLSIEPLEGNTAVRFE